MNKILAIIVVALGSLMVTGIIHNVPAANNEPCTINDKLLDVIKDQQKKISDVLVADIQAANYAKQEANLARKKYEDLVIELRNKPCVK